TTRRTETELVLNDGQTFAIAGLLNNSVNSTMQKIPGIGDIPILGALFKSKAAQKDQTELVVMITPQIVTRASVGVTGSLPRTPATHAPGVVAAPAPAPAAAPAQATPAQQRPLTEQERKVVERARAQEEAARKADGVNKARQDEALKRAAKAEEERQAKLAVE